MIGVDRTEIRSRPNAARSSTANGVAGRNMVIGYHAAHSRSRCRILVVGMGVEKEASVLETRLVEKKRPMGSSQTGGAVLIVRGPI